MRDKQFRIKIAVQKSGRLTDNSIDLFVRCGLKYSKGHDQLLCYGENMPVDLLLVRDDDIPALVREDVCDLGIVGKNTAEEKRLDPASPLNGSEINYVRDLDFGHCRLSLAVPEGTDYVNTDSLENKRIATSYPNILGDYLKEHKISAEVVTFSGAVELAPRLGKADYICDLVSTGSTLAANRLWEADTVMESQATLIQTPVQIPANKLDWLERLKQRVEGVLQVKESKYIMLHAPREAIEEITALLPGTESPTVIPLEGRTDKVALHAVCRENVFWETLESLKRAGASSVLVLPVEKMLA